MSGVASFDQGGWRNFAACKGKPVSIFFPKRGETSAKGIAICQKCPVTAHCGQYADEMQIEHGVWGGALRNRFYQSDQEKPVIPHSFSASSAESFEQCPARWVAENHHRTPSVNNTAAALGTACHAAMEVWVRDGHWAKPYPDQMEIMSRLFEAEYWKLFVDAHRFQEGLDLLKRWLARQDWSDIEILSTETKKHFVLPVDGHDIRFNYIMDRVDFRISTGEIEIVDYKTLSRPLKPEQIRHKLQARVYALAAQLEYPDVRRVWVTFDMLRYDPVGVAFTKEENQGTWHYLKALLRRVLAMNETDAPEILGSWCRFCVRKHQCQTLQRHVAGGGPLGITDPKAAALKRVEIAGAIDGLTAQLAELDEVVLQYMEKNDLQSFPIGDNLEAAVSISARRSIDQARLEAIVGPEIFSRYGSVSMKNLDEMLKVENLTDEQKSRVRQLVTRNYGAPFVSVRKVEDS